MSKLSRLAPDGSPVHASLLHNLGNGLSERYTRTDALADLQQTISAFEQSLALTPEGSIDHAVRLNNLGDGLRERYVRTGILADLELAIGAFEQSVSLIPEGSPEHASLYNNLGIGLSNRYAYTKALPDLEKAIAAYEQVVALSSKNSPDNTAFLNNVGTGLRSRYAHTGKQADLERAIDTFKQVTQAAFTNANSHTLGFARNWTGLLFLEKRWKDFPKAFQSAQTISTRLLKAQATRSDKEAWLKDMQGIAAQATYAFAQLGKPEQAALALEQGCAHLLSETLALNHTDIKALRDSPQPELYQAYTDALTAYQNAQHIQKPEIQQQALRDAWKNLDAVIEQIRQVEGFEQFLQPAGFEEIEQAAERPLLYLAVTAQGGVGVCARKEVRSEDFSSSRKGLKPLPQTSTFFLPQLDEAQLHERLSAYLNAYQQRDQDNMAWALWEARLQDLCRWLGEIFLKPLRETLPELKEITLILLGLLSLLPLHAATDGQRSALDDLRITYAPNARSLNRARRIRESTGDDRLLAVEDPKNNIDYAVYATESLRRCYPHAKIYQHTAASHDKVFNALPNYDILHFYCHGKTDTEHPLHSLLGLADKNLSLKTLLEKGQLKARLALLCACETGMLADLQRAEEFVSLSTGLLQAGSAAVIASLWSVRDDSTMILISFFIICGATNTWNPPRLCVGRKFGCATVRRNSASRFSVSCCRRRQ